MDGKTKTFSYRHKGVHAPRLDGLIRATGHTRAHFFDAAIEAHLPVLEKRHAAELEEERQKIAASCAQSSGNAQIQAHLFYQDG